MRYHSSTAISKNVLGQKHPDPYATREAASNVPRERSVSCRMGREEEGTGKEGKGKEGERVRRRKGRVQVWSVEFTASVRQNGPHVAELS
jgi:hypothetical protein